MRYEKACWCRLFYFDGKNTQRHQFDYRYSIEAPIALAIGLPDVGGEFGSCSLIIGILQSLSSNAFPTALAHHIYKGVTLRASYARYECMGVL
ncbi:hypothetical protein MWE_0198 [Helicobacter pylori XZ274]|nr:hypothetical protein MWE_0198 [Helicobacter pylori XZ274]